MGEAKPQQTLNFREYAEDSDLHGIKEMSRSGSSKVSEERGPVISV